MDRTTARTCRRFRMKKKRGAGRKRRSIKVKVPGAGRPKQYDAKPSAFAMAKRRALAADGDPNKTATPLDLLESRGLITADHNDAGRDYGWLRRMVFGRTDARSLDLTRVAGRDLALESLDWEKIEGRYRLLSQALGTCGVKVRKATDAVCIYNRYPNILLPTKTRSCLPSLGDATQLDGIVEGLDALDGVRRSLRSTHEARRPGPPSG